MEYMYLGHGLNDIVAPTCGHGCAPNDCAFFICATFGCTGADCDRHHCQCNDGNTFNSHPPGCDFLT